MRCDCVKSYTVNLGAKRVRRRVRERGEALLFLHLTDFGFHLFEIWIWLSLGMRQWFFDHKEFVQFVRHVKVCFVRL